MENPATDEEGEVIVSDDESDDNVPLAGLLK